MKYPKNDPILKGRRRGLRLSQTDAEGCFWAQVRNKRFLGLKFFRQYSLGPYILDFYCPAIKLAVELDGGQHSEPDVRDYDKARTEYLNAHRIIIVRFWNNAVLTDMPSVLAELETKVTPLTPLT